MLKILDAPDDKKPVKLAGRPLIFSGPKQDEPLRKRDQKAEDKKEEKRTNQGFRDFILGKK